MAEETPELGATFVLDFEAGDKNFPILAVKKDPTVAGYSIPALLDPHPLSDRFPDHVFGEVQPYRGSKTRVLWLYYKLPGPPLVTRSIGQESLIPQKYRRLIQSVDTKQSVPVATEIPGSLTGNQSKIVITQESVAKSVRNVTEELIQEATDPLAASRLGEWGLETALEEIVVDGTAADTGADVIESQVQPFGNGKSLRVTWINGSPVASVEIDQIDPRVPKSRATREYSLISSASAIPDDGKVAETWVMYERKRFRDNPARAIQVKTTLTLPEDYEEYVSNSFAFPQLFFGYEHFEGLGEFVQERASYSRNIPMRIEHSFGFSAVSVTPVKIQEAKWSVAGYSSHGLTNEEEVTVGGSSFGNLPPSIPSRPTYLASWIGEEKLIDGDSKIWLGGIYKTTQVYVVME